MLKAIGSKKDLFEQPYYRYIGDLLKTEEIQKLAGYTHHIHTTRLQHSINVSYYTFLLCRFLRLNEEAAARAGLLHDLFYYNRKEYVRSTGESFHNSRHPKIAFENASQHFEISPLEKDIILKHMWPLTITPPRYKESFIIVLVDKYCAMLELLCRKKPALA